MFNMSRSSWKYPYICNFVRKESEKIKGQKNRKILLTQERAAVIDEVLISDVKSQIGVYNGHIYRQLSLKDDMVGFRLGEFVLNRVPFEFKKSRHKRK